MLTVSPTVPSASFDAGKPMVPQMLKYFRKWQGKFADIVTLLESTQENHKARRKILTAESVDAAGQLPEVFTLAE